MEASENIERRYNTRFRGVRKSVFTCARYGKKPGPKVNNSTPEKKKSQDDFVYTKLGKKQALEENNVVDDTGENKNEADTPPCKASKKANSNTIPNGFHHEKVEPEDVVPVKIEEPKVELDPENDVEHEPESPLMKDTSSLEKELHVGDDPNLKAIWIASKETLSWDNSTVASYNPKTKMFRCVVCQAVGFMSRIGEHYLGTHCNAKVFHCPQCSYCSAWWRCVRNHMSKNHGVTNAPASMWKNQPLLDEIMQLLQNLKYSVDCEDREIRVAENSGKRYICPKCPYATDRRDLYNRHENIHREEKPFQCYICYKLFNRADHVKKHFCRIHKDYDYDINLIRRLPSKRSRLPVSPLNGLNTSSVQPSDTPVTSSVSSALTKPLQITQSRLLNCLSGSPTMVKVNREIDHHQDLIKKEKEVEESKESTFNKSHSSLLSYLTQSAFSPKPLQPQAHFANTINSQEYHPIKPIEEPRITLSSAVQSSLSKQYTCPYCPWIGMDMWSFRVHSSIHSKHFCSLCNFKSVEAAELELHLWECHKKRLCTKCNYLADSVGMLDAHINEVHVTKQPFMCRHCSQSFQIRSDMEAHCIFIHNQVLQECKVGGCDFCTTDPIVLEKHRQEIHIASSSQGTESASRTQCLYCGCDFADPQSLSLHEILFHENSLQKALCRPLDPYCCAVCGYATPKQPMMMEHMRIHTGQTLRCQAGDGCFFRTPYDTVLREHVQQNHCVDDGIVRCPHCGYSCSTRYSFVSHYEEHHHPFCCHLCEEVEYKHFVMPSSSSCLDSTIAALFPFAKKVNCSNSSNNQKKSQLKEILNLNYNIPRGAIVVDAVRRSRKQSKPRKIVQGPRVDDQSVTNISGATSISRNNITTTHRLSKNFISLYAKKVKSLAQISLMKCKFCVKFPLYFRHKQNFIFHLLMHNLKKYKCKNCTCIFKHRYQVLLHNKREHKLLIAVIDER